MATVHIVCVRLIFFMYVEATDCSVKATISEKIIYKYSQQNHQRKHWRVTCTVTLVILCLHGEISNPAQRLSVFRCIGSLTVGISIRYDKLWLIWMLEAKQTASQPARQLINPSCRQSTAVWKIECLPVHVINLNQRKSIQSCSTYSGCSCANSAAELPCGSPRV